MNCNLSFFVIEGDDVGPERALEQVEERRRVFRADRDQVELLCGLRVVEDRQKVVVLERDGQPSQDHRTVTPRR